MLKGTAWEIGNGRNVNFWLDSWLGMGSRLLDLAIILVPLKEQYKKVRDCVNNNKKWD